MACRRANGCGGDLMTTRYYVEQCKQSSRYIVFREVTHDPSWDGISKTIEEIDDWSDSSDANAHCAALNAALNKV